MIKLPSEVFNLIFRLLVQRDRLECMTVCREWHDHISRHHSLFREILIQHQRQLTNLIKTVKTKPVMGAKVEKLSLRLKLNLKDYVTTFEELFPDLRHFAITHASCSNQYLKSIAPHKSHSWYKHIKKMLENSSYIYTQMLLQSGPCPNLTFISVNGQLFQALRDLIEALPNAPALKTLQLSEYLLSFGDLELLHQNVPHLETLLMMSIGFNSTPLPRHIKPATSLRSFRWVSSDVDEYDDINPYLPYVFQKYTHLEELALEFGIPGNTSDEGHGDSVAQYKKMLRSFLRKLAPGLKTLSLSVDIYAQHFYTAFDFKVLDECGCQVRTLNFESIPRVYDFEQLSNTTQVRYLQSLDMDIELGKDDQSRFMECIRSFTILKELKLGICASYHQKKQHGLNLADLLDALRETRLEILVLRHLELTLDKKSTIRPYPWLKNLSCVRVTFGVDTNAFISKSLPNLKNLELNNCFGEREMITLPQTNLMYLKLIKECRDHALQGLVITLDNNQKRLYTTSSEYISVSDDCDMGERAISSLVPVFSEPYIQSSNVPFVTIICKSVYHVSFLKAYAEDLIYV